MDRAAVFVLQIEDVLWLVPCCRRVHRLVHCFAMSCKMKKTAALCCWLCNWSSSHYETTVMSLLLNI